MIADQLLRIAGVEYPNLSRANLAWECLAPGQFDGKSPVCFKYLCRYFFLLYGSLEHGDQPPSRIPISVRARFNTTQRRALPSCREKITFGTGMDCEVIVAWHSRAPDEVTRRLRLLVLLETIVEEAGPIVGLKVLGELMSRSNTGLSDCTQYVNKIQLSSLLACQWRG